MAVITNRTANRDRTHRVLIFLAAVWIAISLAVGGAAIPNDDRDSPAQAVSREAPEP